MCVSEAETTDRQRERNRDVGKIDGFQKKRIRVLSKSESRSIELQKDGPHVRKLFRFY